MKRYLKAENLKYRRTFLWELAVLMPGLCTVLSAFLTSSYFAMDGYNWWYITMFPGLLAIVCGQIGGKDLKKQNRTIWTLPADMGKIWDAKILMSATVAGFSTLFLLMFVLMGTSVMGRGMHITFLNAPTVREQILAGVLIWLTSLWQIPFCLFLTQKMGSLVMIMVNLGFSQVLGVLVSLKNWFFLIPYGITPRVMCPVLKTLPNGLPAKPGQATYCADLMSIRSAVAGVLVSFLWFIGLWYFTKKWFKRQVKQR